MRTNPEKIERISIIVGALFGVIAFSWQLYNNYDAKREKVKVDVQFEYLYEEENLQSMKGMIDITNTGQQPIYIKHISVKGIKSEGSTAVMSYFNEDNTNPEPIQPGASRLYILPEIDYGLLKNPLLNQLCVNLVVESPVKVLFEQNLDHCFTVIVARAENDKKMMVKFHLGKNAFNKIIHFYFLAKQQTF